MRRSDYGKRHVGIAVLAMTALVVLVLAVPAALVRVGGVPFVHWSALAHLLGAHRSYDPDLVAEALIRVAVVVAWLSWVWMTACVLLEIRSWVTGRSPTRLPASRTLQSVAASLVGTALIAASAGRIHPSASTVGLTFGRSAGSDLPALRVIDDLPFGPSVLFDVEAPQKSSFRPAAGSDRSTHLATQGRDDEPVASVGAAVLRGDGELLASPPEGRICDARTRPSLPLTEDARVHVVTPRETLWSIAADCLGSSLRWRELASLNYGLPQNDGEALNEEHWIRPGWRLVLPPPEGSDPVSVDTIPHPFGTPPVPDLAGRRSSLVQKAAGDRNQQSALDPVTDHHRLESDGVAEVRRSRLGGSRHGPSQVDGRGLSAEWPGPVTPLGGIVLGAGVTGLLDQLRRVQQRHRRTGRVIRLPRRTETDIERRLRVGEGREVVAAVDQALSYLARTCRDTGTELPEVRGIVVRPDSVDLAVEPVPLDGTDPGEARRETRVTFDRSLLPVGSPVFRRSPRSMAPLLVTAGRRADGLVFVNLESLGVLFVNGSPAGCEGVLRALALELATSFWSGRFDLVLAGFGSEFERFERVTATSDVSVLEDVVWRHRIRADQLLKQTGYSSFAQARLVEDSTRWDPLVVIGGPSIDEDAVTDLLTAVDRRRGVAAVVVGEGSDASKVVRLSDSDSAPSLDLLSSVLFPQQIDAEELAALSALLDVAVDRQSTFRSEEPYVSLPVPLPGANGPDAQREEREGSRTDGTVPTGGRPSYSASRSPNGQPEVEVSILGPIDIRGAEREFTRAWAKELVVYLALHPRGATNEAWATALWPDRIMAPSSLHSTASVARRSLGRARNGEDHLPHSHGRLALADTVTTDWERFVALADEEDVESWRCALELVRGRPFEGLRSSDWPILEGIGPAIESAIIDVAGRRADACLAADDARGARWAARKGLLVSPYDERLYRILMRAADLDGNPAGVEAAMAELVRLVADDIEPFDSVHPATIELYRSLTRRRTTGLQPR